MRGSYRNRLVAVLAIVALLIATSTYLAHGRDDLTAQHDDARCALCLQFSGTAGAPEIGSPVKAPAHVTRLSVSKPQTFLSSGRKAGVNLPRAPPAIA